MEEIIGPLYVVIIGVSIFAAAGAIAWVYDKTRRRIQHPVLGELTYTGGSWCGAKPHFVPNRAAVRIELPGGKSGPDSEAVERLEQLWNERDSVLEKIAPYAIDEMRDCLEAIEPSETQEFFGFAYQDGMPLERRHLENTWFLSEVSLRDAETDDRATVPKWCWTLEFDVAWDEEHPRAAHLDLDRNVLAYDLACAVFVPES